MNLKFENPSMRRFVVVLIFAIALPIVAVAPAFVASLFVNSQGGESTDITVEIDVTDIDQDGGFKYSVPPNSSVSDGTESVTPAELIRDADIIKIEITGDEPFPSSLGYNTSDGCAFTLHVSSDDPFDAKTDSFIGYIKVTNEESTESCATSLGDGFLLVSDAPVNGS